MDVRKERRRGLVLAWFAKFGPTVKIKKEIKLGPAVTIKGELNLGPFQLSPIVN
jgi:acyl-[acyl carrier protein]--UDP-N-acetylglucosamine O-acyltransferase